MALEDIQQSIQYQELPNDFRKLFGDYIDLGTKTITAQEGNLWDFKEQFPFSWSDDFFGGILRLTCAFANTYGGLIVFGVHDKRRTVGHNKVRIDIEKLNNFLRSTANSPITLQHRQYKLPELQGSVDVLLVPPRPLGSLPIKISKAIGKFPANKIWIRQGHEALEAEPRHIPLLYCRSGLSEAEQIRELGGSLPPSPGTVKTFVGRLEAIDKLFSWLLKNDEPRTFLYGKGGSGKTTIAYEFGRVVKSDGGNLTLPNGRQIDQVIFVSAKEKALDTVASRIEDYSLDFANEEELYRAILSYGDWLSYEEIKELTLEQLKHSVAEFVDTVCALIIIDDADTLTTKKIEGGFDFLYRSLCRTNSGSKILYTVRNAPTHSIVNSIEVPGLPLGGEYERFTDTCARQFKVAPPDPKFRDTEIAKVTEQRPLLIESIVGIRRNCDTYERAISLFQSKVGDDARTYVFKREWAAIDDPHARTVLVALALFNRRVSFDELLSVLNLEDRVLNDAIAAVSEMFLQIEASTTTSYELGDLTRSFILSEGKSLDKYPYVKATVDAYKRNFYPKNPLISSLETEFERILRRSPDYVQEQLRSFWTRLNSASIPASTTQDPRFRALVGRTACKLMPYRMQEARDAFEFCIKMKFEIDVFTLRDWNDKERNSGMGHDYCLRISDMVIAGRRYSAHEKCEFIARKGFAIFSKAQSEQTLNPTDSFKNYREALLLHLSAYFYGVQSSNPKAYLSTKYASSTAARYFLNCLTTGNIDGIFDFFKEATKRETIFLDPIVDPLSECMTQLRTNVFALRMKDRMVGKLQHLTGQLRDLPFNNNHARERCLERASETTAYFNAASSQKASKQK